MLSRVPRSVRWLAGLVLVLAVLAALSAASAHAGQHSLVHHDCLACRLSADSVVVLAVPPPPLRLECVGAVPSAADEAASAASVTLASSRAPPPA